MGRKRIKKRRRESIASDYYGYIYRVDILDRGAYYIGQALVSNRGVFPGDPVYYGSGRKIKAYIKEHGVKNLEVSLLAVAFSQDELNKLEKEFIGEGYLEKGHKVCWNLKEGGSQSKFSEESRALMSLNGKGKVNVNKGKKLGPLPQETRDKLSISGKLSYIEGRRVPPRSMLGRKHSQETLEKMRKSQMGRSPGREAIEKARLANLGRTPWNKGKKTSDETRLKISLSLLGVKHSEEFKKTVSEKMKKYKWFNNGVKNTRAEFCPIGFHPGRLAKEGVLPEQIQKDLDKAEEV